VPDAFVYLQSLAATCGGTYIGQRGVIQSPGFPLSSYPSSSSCEWYLEGPTGHYLTLSYGNFSLQSSVGCTADYVEIKEYNASGENTRGPDRLLFTLAVYISNLNKIKKSPRNASQ